MLTDHNAYLTAVAKATAAAQAYYDTDTLIMSDEAYDALIEDIELAGRVNDWHDGDALSTKVAADTAAVGDVKHIIPMLSLGKLKEIDDVLKFIERYPTEPVVFEPKLDGLAITARYANGRLTQVATRGNGESGEDLTPNAARLRIKGLPNYLKNLDTIEVRGEIFIGGQDFVAAQRGRIQVLGEKNRFANPRNAVAGSLRTDKDVSYVTMTFAAYEALGLAEDSYSARMGYLTSLGFITALSLVPAAVTQQHTIKAKIEAFGDLRGKLDAPTDGAVVKFDSYRLRNALGAASRHPRWAAAFKYEEEIKQTVLRDIVREVGRTGAISYVGITEPVQFDSLISRFTLNNSDFIAKHDLRLGDTLLVRKANGVIPEVRGVNITLRPASAQPYVAPVTCPRCGQPLDVTSSAVWRCTNPEDALGALLSYAVSKNLLDVDSLSTAIIDDLLNGGYVNDLADLFTLTPETLARVERRDSNGEVILNSDGTVRALRGKGKDAGTLVRKIHANLQHAKQNQPLARVLSALGIRMMGRTFGRRLAVHFGNIDSIQRATIEDFMAVEGVAEGRAEEFVRGFIRNRALLTRLRQAGFTALQPNQNSKQPDPKATSNSRALQGLTIVVTGSIPGYSRTGATELIERLGGKASSTPSAKTSLVVAGEGAGSKVDKARDLGLRILAPLEFLDLIKQLGG